LSRNFLILREFIADFFYFNSSLLCYCFVFFLSSPFFLLILLVSLLRYAVNILYSKLAVPLIYFLHFVSLFLSYVIFFSSLFLLSIFFLLQIISSCRLMFRCQAYWYFVSFVWFDHLFFLLSCFASSCVSIETEYLLDINKFYILATNVIFVYLYVGTIFKPTSSILWVCYTNQIAIVFTVSSEWRKLISVCVTIIGLFVLLSSSAILHPNCSIQCIKPISPQCRHAIHKLKLFPSYMEIVFTRANIKCY
jgi:hypothetical protein